MKIILLLTTFILCSMQVKAQAYGVRDKCVHGKEGYCEICNGAKVQQPSKLTTNPVPMGSITPSSQNAKAVEKRCDDIRQKDEANARKSWETEATALLRERQMHTITFEEFGNRNKAISSKWQQILDQIEANHGRCLANIHSPSSGYNPPSPTSRAGNPYPNQGNLNFPGAAELERQQKIYTIGVVAGVATELLGDMGQGSRERFDKGMTGAQDKVDAVNNQNNQNQPKDDKGIMQNAKNNNLSLEDLGPGQEEDEADESSEALKSLAKPIEKEIEKWFDEGIGDKIYLKGSEMVKGINKVKEYWDSGQKLVNGNLAGLTVLFPNDNKIQEISRDVTIGQAKAQIEAVNRLSQRMDADGMPNLTEETMEQDIKNLNVINHLPVISNAVPIANKAIEYYQQLSSQFSSVSVKDMTKTIIAGGLVGAAAAISTPVALTFLGALYISRNP